MANTYTQLHVQMIFAVANRRGLISESNREEVERYMCGILRNMKSKVHAIYCNPDHCHILIGIHPENSISDLVRNVKAQTSKWINDRKLTEGRFNWQEGYAAFTYQSSDIKPIRKYICSQPEHHQTKTFKQEYIEFLTAQGIDFDERYIFLTLD
jgi:REP element-mobilizing transposase RayT